MKMKMQVRSNWLLHYWHKFKVRW